MVHILYTACVLCMRKLDVRFIKGLYILEKAEKSEEKKGLETRELRDVFTRMYDDNVT